ncbi:MAG TPA: ROK family protein [Candidatus Nanoarchaeia archaeon]|nr:ROK family protein [Candidatus Nanoarchaeia archaeon]
MTIIGVDIGGTGIRAGVVLDGRVISKVKLETESSKGKKVVLKNIVLAIRRVMRKDVSAICIGCPGPINAATGLIGKIPNVPLKNVNIKELVVKEFKKKVYTDNDAKCFALAESSLGKGKGYHIVLGCTIGTGFGSGLVIDGKIYHGKCSATELGHMSINFDGPKGKCGNHGCLESYVSVKGILSRAKAPDVKELYDRALKGDKTSIQAFEETGFYLGVGLSNAINIFDPDIIIVGGQISKAWKFFSPKMKETIKERAMFNCRIVKSELKDAGILGASFLSNNCS